MDLKKSYPYLLAILIFYVVVIIFFRENVLNDKSLHQSDVIQFEGMNSWPNKFVEETGKDALWNDGMFSGMPNYTISTGTDSWIPSRVKDVLLNLIPNSMPASALMLCVVCFAVLMIAFDIRWELVIVGALIYGFNTYNVINIEVGHNTKTWAIAFASLVLAGLRFSFKGNKRIGIPLLTLGLTLELAANHIQITFYLMFVCFIYVISEVFYAYRENRLKEVLNLAPFLFIALLVGVGTKTCKLMIDKEYAEYSTRGKQYLKPSGENEDGQSAKGGLDKEYAFSWSQGKMESFTLLVPYFYGGGSSEKLQKGSNVHQLFEKLFGKQRTKKFLKSDQVKIPLYFGDQPFTAGPLYIGAITCFLFILGIIMLEGKHIYWMLSAALLCLFFAWGRNFAFFNYFLFDYFPLFNKFRSVSMALSLTLILMPLLGFIALNEILKLKGKNGLEKKMFLAGAIVSGFLLLTVFYSYVGDFSLEKDAYYGQQYFGENDQAVSGFVSAVREDRASFLRSDAIKSLFLILITIGLLWAYFKNRLKLKWVILVLGLIYFGDMWTVAKRYLYDSRFQKEGTKTVHKKTAADNLILNDKDPHYRVYNLRGAFSEAYTSYYHKSIGGYFAAKMRRYQDLIEHRLTPESQELVTLLRSGSRDYSSMNILNMLNAKYFKFGDKRENVIRNDAALGNSWFVNELIPVLNADEEMNSLGTINTSTQAVVNMNEFGLEKNNYPADSTANISLEKFETLKLTYKSKSRYDGFVLFSEIYYPEGWIAKIDGKEVPILRANYVLRALQVPKGEHEIVFEFNPQTFNTGYLISQIGGYLFFIIVFGGFGFTFYKYLKEDNNSEPSLSDNNPSIKEKDMVLEDRKRKKSRNFKKKKK